MEMKELFFVPATFNDNLSHLAGDEELLNRINQTVERPLKCILPFTHEETPDWWYMRQICSECDPLTLVIKVHLFVEHFLDQMIRKKFKHSSRLKGFQMNFFMKLEILRAKDHLNRKVYHDLIILNHLRHKFIRDPMYDISKFNVSKFHYSRKCARHLQDKSKEIKREANLYILKIILIFLLVRIKHKHPFKSEVQAYHTQS